MAPREHEPTYVKSGFEVRHVILDAPANQVGWNRGSKLSSLRLTAGVETGAFFASRFFPLNLAYQV